MRFQTPKAVALAAVAYTALMISVSIWGGGDLLLSILVGFNSILAALLAYGYFRQKRQLEKAQHRGQVLKRHISQRTISFHTSVLKNLSYFRRPLNGLVGIKDIFTNSPKQNPAEYLDIVESCSQKLARQVERLQLFSDLNTNIYETSVETISLKSLVRRASRAISTINGHIPLIFRESWAPNCPDLVLGDGKLLYNLLVECFELSIQNGASQNLMIKVCPDPNKFGNLSITVSDNSAGMSEHIIMDLNHPFCLKSRRHGLPDNPKQLAVDLIKLSVKQMQGAMRVESAPSGAHISLYLPLPAAVNSIGTAHIKRPPQDLTIARVLIVEDDASCSFMLAKHLSRLGLMPDVVPNGQEALLKIQSVNYRAVFIDLFLPVIDGYQCTQAIIHQLTTQGVALPKIIATTELATRANKIQFINAGGSGLLEKPITFEMISELVHQFDLSEKAPANEKNISNVVPLFSTAAPAPVKKREPLPKTDLVDFAALLVDMDDDMDACHDLIELSVSSLSMFIEQLESLYKSKNISEMSPHLQKIHTEFMNMKCPRGTELVTVAQTVMANSDYTEMRKIIDKLMILGREIFAESIHIKNFQNQDAA